MPEMIRYYLNEAQPGLGQDLPVHEPARPGLCAGQPRQAGGQTRQRVRRIWPDGGAPCHRAKRAEFARLIEANPRNYIAQPTCPVDRTDLHRRYRGTRHLDLRPFILQGRDTWVTPGSLTRVALVKGSLVVNSSPGRRQQDTWIVEDNGKMIMLSRVAERLYWMARYLERAEDIARLDPGLYPPDHGHSRRL